MTSRVVAALRVVGCVAERLDPTEPLGVGAIATALGAQLSSVSRWCSELDRLGFLERGEEYGTYRIGPLALRLSGRAAAPFARSVRLALTRAGQQTGETAFLATVSPGSAGSAGAARVVASVASAWTLHSPAEVGEAVLDPSSAVVRAAEHEVVGPRFLESTLGRCVEIATPVQAPGGEVVAVVAIRLPVNRSRGVPRARRALDLARRTVERALVEPGPARQVTAATAGPPTALQAAFRILDHLADGPDTLVGTASATGLRPDRTLRLLASCRSAGVVWTDGAQFHRLAWSLHGWHRAASGPTLVTRGGPLVAEVAAATGACGFITVLRGMRSLTVVEELEQAGEGVVMMPWLGRPHPIIGSDGGPTLVMDFTPEEVEGLLAHRHTPAEFETLRLRMRRVVRDGVLATESIEEGGLTSVSAPVRDAAGCVVAAACLVGTIEWAKPRTGELQRAARDLAERITALLT